MNAIKTEEYLGLNSRNCSNVRGLAERLGTRFISIDQALAGGIFHSRHTETILLWQSEGATHLGIDESGQAKPALLKQ